MSNEVSFKNTKTIGQKAWGFFVGICIGWTLLCSGAILFRHLGPAIANQMIPTTQAVAPVQAQGVNQVPFRAQ